MTGLRRRLSVLKRLAKACVGRDLFLREQVAIRRERHGTDYGGWWIHPNLLGRDSVVYSFGVGDDISFDCSLIEAFGLRVHAFDPTPRSIAWLKGQKVPSAFEFHPIGVADFDGEAVFDPPAGQAHMSYSIRATPRAGSEPNAGSVHAGVRRLTSIMAMLGHREIDLLKFDIEGAEYSVIPDVLSSRVPAQQWLIEFHHGYRGFTARQTRRAVAELNTAGYRIFSVAPTGREYSFIRRA